MELYLAKSYTKMKKMFSLFQIKIKEKNIYLHFLVDRYFFPLHLDFGFESNLGLPS